MKRLILASKALICIKPGAQLPFLKFANLERSLSSYPHHHFRSLEPIVFSKSGFFGAPFCFFLLPQSNLHFVGLGPTEFHQRSKESLNSEILIPGPIILNLVQNPRQAISNFFSHAVKFLNS